MKRVPLWRWMVLVLLGLLPAVLYWDTIFHRFGFRDDYAVLRESREEPGTIMAACAAQGRPLYGLLMVRSFSRLGGIEELQWLRLGSAGLLGLLAAVLYVILRREKWDRTLAALVAALLTVLPGAQLLVGWAVAWPLTAALLLSLGGYLASEHGAVRAERSARIGWWLMAVGCVAGSALIYQPNSMFYLVPVAAGLWPRRRWAGSARLEWLVGHGATVTLGLAVAAAFTLTAFALGWFPHVPRMGLESDLVGKLQWFVAEPLKNAFATIVLDVESGTQLAERVSVIVAFLIMAGVAREWQTRGWRHGLWWGLAVAVLLLGSFSVDLLGANRWTNYRTLLPLTGVVLVFLVVAMMSLGGRRVARGSLMALLVAGGWFAHRQAYELIAWPQGVELTLLERGAARISPTAHRRVFVVTPAPPAGWNGGSVAAEFGSWSSTFEWAPREMLALILQERRVQPRNSLVPIRCATGHRPPPPGTYDVVIDLRPLHQVRARL